jgi:dolichyl-phosphate-mannose--protein O-mannosyl transferase
MALWIGGAAHFGEIVASFMAVFLGIFCFAAIVGACFKSSRVRWSILTGAFLGLAGGTALVLIVMSNI